MGRGPVRLRRIENKVNRQVTFSKRRAGLLKKSHEIAVLCDADVAVIVFSGNGKLCEYASKSSMEKILDRYQRYTYEEGSLTEVNIESQESWSDEYSRLKYKVDALQKSQSHLLGEQLDSLSFKDLQQLEQQLDSSLKHIRVRKSKLLFDSIADLQKKEKLLVEENNMLQKMADKEKANAPSGAGPRGELQLQPELQPISPPSPRLITPAPLPEANTGSVHSADTPEAEPEMPARRRATTNLPPWLLGFR